MKLHIGCGKNIRRGFVNLDAVPLKGVDVVYDLEKMPLPFKDSSFTYIVADNVLEHIQNLLGLMKEIHRICKRGAIVEIIVPHFRSVNAFSDPTHKRFFTTSTFDYFEKNNPNYFYINAPFRVVAKRLSFCFKNPKKLQAKLYDLLIKPIEFLANLNPSVYEYVFSHLVPPSYIILKLKADK